MKTNKRVLAGLIAIGLLALTVGWGTYAYFSDIETSEDNILTAGTIDIAVDDENPWIKTYSGFVEDMKPCEKRWINFTITNVGSNPVEVWKHLRVTGTDGGAEMAGFEPASSEPEWQDGIVRLFSMGGSTAGWTTEQAKFGTHSAKLTMPAMTGWVEDNAEARMTISERPKIKDIGSWSYWIIAPDSYTVPIEFYVDTDGDCRYDKIIIGQKAGDTPEGWFEVDKDYLSMYMAWKNGYEWLFSWDKVVEKYGEATLLRVDIGYGSLGSNQAVTAYVDDFTIDGITHEFEPDKYIEKCDIDTVITYDLYVDDTPIITQEDEIKIRDIDCYWIYLGTIPVGGSMTVKQSYHLQPCVGNWAQGDKMTFDIEIYAEQLGGPGPSPIWPE